ncbi:MAG: hypothetical protein D3922_03830 [Candidatus Electrothrix sp. AR1]|nr:hypothetical protein [Candidatus Electrothrix sp. AR1]
MRKVEMFSIDGPFFVGYPMGRVAQNVLLLAIRSGRPRLDSLSKWLDRLSKRGKKIEVGMASLIVGVTLLLDQIIQLLMKIYYVNPHIEWVDIIFFELNHLKKQDFTATSFIPTG